MKTAIEHFNTLPEPYKSEALEALNIFPLYIKLGVNEKYATILIALTHSFQWGKTPQGFEYWENLYRSILKSNENKNETLPG